MRILDHSNPSRIAFVKLFCFTILLFAQPSYGQEAEIYAAYNSRHEISVISPEGEFVRTIPHQFGSPMHALEYADGKTHVFGEDTTRFTIQPNGQVETIELDAIGSIYDARGSVAKDGRYITSVTTSPGQQVSRLFVHSPDGTLQWSNEIVEEDAFYRQADSDNEGNIYAVYGTKIHKFDRDGNLVEIADTFGYGWNIAVDDESNQLLLGYRDGGIGVFDISQSIEYLNEFGTIGTSGITTVSDIEYHAPTSSIYYSNLRSVFEVTLEGEHLREISIATAGELMPFFTLVPEMAELPGDFDMDGQYGCDDIDALSIAISAGNNDMRFDLTSDGVIDGVDQAVWLELAGVAAGIGGAFHVGDANLDGFVDTSDFNLWNQNKFTSGAAWCGGDFNHDGTTDVSDFNLWNFSKGLGPTQSVPEPSGTLWLVVSLAAAMATRRNLCRVIADDHEA